MAPSQVLITTDSMRIRSTWMPAALAKVALEPTAVMAVPVFVCRKAHIRKASSANKASIMNVVIGTILFQGIVTMTPTVMNGLINLDISEVLRMVISNGMILYALTRKTEASR